MQENSFQTGTIQRLDNGFEGRLERVIEHPAAEVWRMLTEPQSLAQWLAQGTIELRQGGAVRIDFADSGIVIESTVTAFEQGRILEYSWSSGTEPQRPLRWELHDAPQGTRLVLIVRLPASEDAAKACAGFDAHLEMLLAAIEGVSIQFPFNIYMQARKEYQEMLA